MSSPPRTAEREVWLVNDSAVDVEVYAVDFDARFAADELALRHAEGLKGKPEGSKLFLPPRAAGDGLWAHIQEAEDARLAAEAAAEAAEAAEAATRRSSRRRRRRARSPLPAPSLPSRTSKKGPPRTRARTPGTSRRRRPSRTARLTCLWWARRSRWAGGDGDARRREVRRRAAGRRRRRPAAAAAGNWATLVRAELGLPALEAEAQETS